MNKEIQKVIFTISIRSETHKWSRCYFEDHIEVVMPADMLYRFDLPAFEDQFQSKANELKEFLDAHINAGLGDHWDTDYPYPKICLNAYDDEGEMIGNLHWVDAELIGIPAAIAVNKFSNDYADTIGLSERFRKGILSLLKDFSIVVQ